MSNGIFGNMFDFNGDGDLDIFEQATEFDFLQKMMEDDEKSDSHEDDDSDDGWRDQYYGDEIGLDPDDYDTEEEYQEALDAYDEECSRREDYYRERYYERNYGIA